VSAITDFAVEGSAGVDPSSRWGFCLRTLTWLCYAGIVGMARQVIAVLVIVLSFIFLNHFFFVSGQTYTGDNCQGSLALCFTVFGGIVCSCGFWMSAHERDVYRGSYKSNCSSN
jgi:hypothetical protein